MDRFENINRKLNKKQYLVNYFIVGHPGAGLEDAPAQAGARADWDKRGCRHTLPGYPGSQGIRPDL